MSDGETLQALIEENLELSRDTNTRLTGVEVQVRQIGDTVQRHDTSLYHADEGGLVGRLARVEDRVRLIWAIGGLVGGVIGAWLVGQLLGHIK